MGEKTLKQQIRERTRNQEGLNLDTLGAIMDDVIHKSKVALLVHKEADSNDWQVQGAGCGAVMDFYILLSALKPIYLQMLKEMKGRLKAKELAEALSELMEETLISAVEEEEQ